jgi:hypothetical protein
MTTRGTLSRPPFMENALVDRGDGMFFSSEPPPGIAEPQNLRSDDEWTVMGCALARLKTGDFGVFPHVLDAVGRANDADLWLATALLYSFAAPVSEVRKLSRVFSRQALEKDPELVRLYSKIALHTMVPAFVDPVLDLYATTEDDDVRELVPLYLSHILEDEPGPVAAGPVRKLDSNYPPEFADHYWDRDAYAVIVRGVRDQVVAAVGSDLVPVLGGAPFHVATLARRIIRHAKEGDGWTRTNLERMAFEANTGISCRDFFTREYPPDFRPLTATAIAEDFLRTEDAASYQPGVRYFFGRPIPP